MKTIDLVFVSSLFLIFALLTGRAAADPPDPPSTHYRSFIDAHPDLYWRKQGISNYSRGRYGEAMTDFRRAARYADKPSQAMIAQMLWNGDGIKPDRVMAYVWADLSAERGYPEFIAARERFWRELSADEQHAAISSGQAVYAEYGDQVAKKREDNALRLARVRITGSRTGHVGNLIVREPVPDGRMYIDALGSQYYADKYWKPKEYWKWQDRVWEKDPEGKVEVGPVQIPPQH